MTLRSDCQGSGCSTRVATCLVESTGSLVNLQAAITAQLGPKEVLLELLYRGCEPSLLSPVKDFTTDKDLQPRFQARYRAPVHVVIRLPRGLEFCVRYSTLQTFASHLC